MKINFEVVKMTGLRVIDDNGKRKKQQKTFMQTVSPFNKNSDGSIKTKKEVEQSVIQQVIEWQEEYKDHKSSDQKVV